MSDPVKKIPLNAHFTHAVQNEVHEVWAHLRPAMEKIAPTNQHALRLCLMYDRLADVQDREAGRRAAAAVRLAKREHGTEAIVRHLHKTIRLIPD